MSVKKGSVVMMKKNQSGVALIAVLLFLILITIAGAIAIRQSTTDLKVAAADQANALLLNSSDSVLASIEELADPGTAQNPNPDYFAIMGQQGLIGYYIDQSTSKVNEQVKRCYTPNSAKMNKLFDLELSSRMQPGSTGHIGGDVGICNPALSEHYASNRQTAMTQMVVKGVKTFGYSTNHTRALAEGEDSKIGEQGITVPKIQIHSVSVLPALSNAKASDIKNCFSKPVGNDVKEIYKEPNDQNMTNCLKDIGVPTTALVEDALVLTEVRTSAL